MTDFDWGPMTPAQGEGTPAAEQLPAAARTQPMTLAGAVAVSALRADGVRPVGLEEPFRTPESFVATMERDERALEARYAVVNDHIVDTVSGVPICELRQIPRAAAATVPAEPPPLTEMESCVAGTRALYIATAGAGSLSGDVERGIEDGCVQELARKAERSDGGLEPEGKPTTPR